MRNTLIVLGLLAFFAWPVGVAATSPLLAWRDPIYIAAGFAGVLGMALLVVQPLLISASGTGLHPMRARRLHRWGGVLLLGLVIAHVLGLWITSPPDVIDVLLLRSPTPFALWGVAAMWAVFGTALLAMMRRKLRPKHWRMLHGTLAAVIVVGSVVHALLIEGTMGMVSKAALCAASLAMAAIALRAAFRR